MFDLLKHNPKVNPLAKEIFINNNDKNLAILIHGFTGSPREMKKLAFEIKEKLNFSIYVPRLPGHGTNSKDF